MNTMTNQWMDKALSSGDAIDVAILGDRQADGTWVLRAAPPEGPDLVDAEREAFISSVGRHVATGVVMAATDSRFYGAAGWECLWLR